MAAPVSFSRWFGSFFLRDKSATQRTLTFAKVCEDRFYVKIELCCQLFANLANFCDNRIFPHDNYSPINSSGVQMIGIRCPAFSHTNAILRDICTFAKCLQFQVSK